MSLYTLSANNILPRVKTPAGLHIIQTNNPLLLSIVGNISLMEARTRIANGNLAFVAYIYNEPAAFGWMATEKAKIGELNHEFMLPEGHRYLWNFRTLLAYKGMGIYPALLQFIIKHAAADADEFWIIHAPENKASLKGITKAGFSYVGDLYIGKTGQLELKVNEYSRFNRDALHTMGFYPSVNEASSCWNCSSPYLKKRKAECCCAEVEENCSNNNLRSLINNSVLN